MNRNSFVLLLLMIFTVVGCNLAGPEEKAIQQMVETFVRSIESGDEDLATACMLDSETFRVINPSAGERPDADNYTEDVLAALVHQYRALRSEWDGKVIEYKSLELGVPSYQYKPLPSFQDNEATIIVDGIEKKMLIEGVVKINQQWRIVTFSGQIN